MNRKIVQKWENSSKTEQLVLSSQSQTKSGCVGQFLTFFTHTAGTPPLQATANIWSNNEMPLTTQVKAYQKERKSYTGTLFEVKILMIFIGLEKIRIPLNPRVISSSV